MITDADFQIDIDRKPEDLAMFADEIADRMAFIMKYTKFKFIRIDIYETTKGFHFYFWSEGATPYPIQKVIIQLALGSDYHREIFNYRRVWNTIEPTRWNVLFQFKYNKEGKMVSKEEKTNKAIRLEEEIMTLYTVKTENEKVGDV